MTIALPTCMLVVVLLTIGLPTVVSPHVFESISFRRGGAWPARRMPSQVTSSTVWGAAARQAQRWPARCSWRARSAWAAKSVL
eukprot:5526494-Pyramimonas_sp.AAC.1